MNLLTFERPMKFGKQIQTMSVPKWKHWYINYKVISTSLPLKSGTIFDKREFSRVRISPILSHDFYAFRAKYFTDCLVTNGKVVNLIHFKAELLRWYH